jgi:hypothetical protein
MKRQVIAVALGSLFALPAFANFELYGNGIAPTAATSTQSRVDVRAELIAAQRAGQVVENAELGTTAQSSHAAGKSRAEVVTEVVQARRSGNYIINAELGTKANQL